MDPAQIVDRINHDGFAIVENFVKYDDLKTAQKFVKDAVAANGGNYLHIGGREKLTGTFLHDLPIDPEFVELCRGIIESGTGKPAPDTEFYQILRCLSGDLVQKHSMVFHYDSYVLTALIPILIPTEGKPGDLLLFPNTRPVRKRTCATCSTRSCSTTSAHKSVSKGCGSAVPKGLSRSSWCREICTSFGDIVPFILMKRSTRKTSGLPPSCTWVTRMRVASSGQ